MKLTHNYSLRSVSGEWLLICKTVPINHQWMYEVNETGAFLIQHCDGCSFAELLDTVEQHYHSPMTTERQKAILEYCLLLEQWGIVKDVQ